MQRLPKYLALVFLAALFAAAPAQAQCDGVTCGGPIYYYPDYTPIINQGIAFDMMNADRARSDAYANSPSSSTPTPKTPKATRKLATRFTATSKVAKKVNTRLASAFAKSDPGFNRTLFLSRANAGAFTKAFNSLIARQGWSGRDLGDTFAGYIVTSWMVIHNVDTLTPDQLKGADSFKTKIRATLLANRKVKKASNTAKQTSAQTLQTVGAIQLGQFAQYRQDGDTASFDALSTGIAEGVLKAFKVDLRPLALTALGFGPPG